MGYANCIAMLENDIDREIIVDGSLNGMGKSAGNAPLELIAMHMNEHYGKNYNIGQLLEAIDANIFEFTRLLLGAIICFLFGRLQTTVIPTMLNISWTSVAFLLIP